ncbi:MAG TPA: spore gernimation protein GerPD [Bacillales bacterium]|nr:spore gernimation protein GerPD [Bacillales bacterium]
MEFNVVNHGISVGSVRITGITTSSVFLVGDADDIKCASAFDTPPESLIIGQPELSGPVVPMGGQT